VTDNIESAISNDNFTAALTDFENGGTTILYAFLNGYPETVGSSVISPEFGLLTNTADGSATGQIDALAQVSNTIADEVANLGGAHLTTGSLPLVSGNLDLSISLNQILSDLGLTSGGGSLSLSQLLSDLGLPSSFTVSDIENLLGVTDNSGFTIGQILQDLGLTDSSGITLGDALKDLGVTGSSGITIGQILKDLGLSDSSGITLGQALQDLNVGSSVSVDQILAALGVVSQNPDGTFTDPTFNLETLLGDLGVTPSTNIDLDTILNAVGINPAQGIGIDTILNDLGATTNGNLTFNVPAVSLSSILSTFGINVNTGINDVTLIEDLIGNPTYSFKVLGISESVSLSTFLNGVGLGNSSLSISKILSDIGINVNQSYTPSSISIPVSNILSDLGLGSNPTVSVNSLLTDLGISNTDPTFTVGSILNDLGITSTSSVGLDSILNDLGISPTAPIDLDSILSALGLSPSDTINIGDILNVLKLSDSSSIDLSQILSALNLDPNSTITIGDILNVLGFSDSTQAINIGDVLGFLGLSDSSSFNVASILSDLGINPNEDIFSLLGLSDTLSLNLPVDITGGSVATYIDDLAKDLMALVGSSSTLSNDLPSLLGTDPTFNLEPLLASLVSDLGLPGAITGGDLPANLTNILAEVLPTLF
jgi:hypothetical protein